MLNLLGGEAMKYAVDRVSGEPLLRLPLARGILPAGLRHAVFW